jgi:hypothetical protein
MQFPMLPCSAQRILLNFIIAKTFNEDTNHGAPHYPAFCSLLLHFPSYVQMGFESQHGQETFFYSTASRSALGPTQPSTQWVQRALSLGV